MKPLTLQKIKDSLIGKTCMCTISSDEKKGKEILDVEHENCWFKLLHEKNDATYIYQCHIKDFIKGEKIEYGEGEYYIYQLKKKKKA